MPFDVTLASDRQSVSTQAEIRRAERVPTGGWSSRADVAGPASPSIFGNRQRAALHSRTEVAWKRSPMTITEPLPNHRGQPSNDRPARDAGHPPSPSQNIVQLHQRQYSGAGCDSHAGPCCCQSSVDAWVGRRFKYPPERASTELFWRNWTSNWRRHRSGYRWRNRTIYRRRRLNWLRHGVFLADIVPRAERRVDGRNSTTNTHVSEMGLAP